MNEFTAGAETQRVSWLLELIEDQLMSAQSLRFFAVSGLKVNPEQCLHRLSEAEGDLVAVLLSSSAEHC